MAEKKIRCCVQSKSEEERCKIDGGSARDELDQILSCCRDLGQRLILVVEGRSQQGSRSLPRFAILGENAVAEQWCEHQPALSQAEVCELSAEDSFEGIALNKTTMRSRTPIHRNSPVDDDIPEAIKASVQGRAPKQPKQTRAPKKVRGQTEYGATEYNCEECLIGFRRPHEQKRHMRETIAHSRPTKRCDACGNKYFRTDALRAHKRSKHGVRRILRRRKSSGR